MQAQGGAQLGALTPQLLLPHPPPQVLFPQVLQGAGPQAGLQLPHFGSQVGLQAGLHESHFGMHVSHLGRHVSHFGWQVLHLGLQVSQRGLQVSHFGWQAGLQVLHAGLHLPQLWQSPAQVATGRNAISSAKTMTMRMLSSGWGEPLTRAL